MNYGEMMVNDLMIELFSVGLAGLLISYTIMRVFLSRRSGKYVYEHLASGFMPIFVLGVFILVLGFVGEITWPLPGGYNTLFYEPYMLFGLLIIVFSLSIYRKLELKYSGMFSFLIGLIAIGYGVAGYSLNMTEAPLVFFMMYLAFGLAGMFALPVSLIFDSFQGSKPKHSKKYLCFVALFCLFIIMGSLIAIGTAAIALPSHLVVTAT